MPRLGRKGSISYARKACFLTWRTSIGAWQQSPLVSYFWLRHSAIRAPLWWCRIPTYAFPVPRSRLNSSEAAVRLVMDSMRWSLPACMYKIRRQRSNHIS